VKSSILATWVRVESSASIENSILFDNVRVGAGARLKHCIIDKYVNIPAGESIGYDLEHDRARFTVSDRGVVVVSKHYQFD
jgi:glucose-1-phosphate adenylyltransferase